MEWDEMKSNERDQMNGIKYMTTSLSTQSNSTQPNYIDQILVYQRNSSSRNPATQKKLRKIVNVQLMPQGHFV